MKLRKLVLVAAAGILVTTAAPEGARADHCGANIFVVSGVGQPDAFGQRAGFNAGSVGCQFDAFTHGPNTAYFTPGATHAWVITAAATGGQPTGTFGTVTLNFSLNDIRGRWESAPVSLAGIASGTAVTATVTAPIGWTSSVTYTKA